ncbi:CCXG family PEP-CTERM protein [uncultured Massilia sp.]|uniref:CCXG family PEP-CTERM protein n=1 Tax=uncultured Massilia sp. TaxID=169973 RepID=UPI00258B0315|nr:CCXG family PEP-CTERM protein [uncultured Massilia sp.]
MNLARYFAMLALAGAAIHADASVITLQTGYSSAGPQASADAYRDVVDAALALQATANTPGYGSKTIDNYGWVTNADQFGARANFAWKSTTDFGVSADKAGAWSLRSGVDFDRGGAMFLDGVAVAFNPNNMWWAGDYANTTQTFAATLNLGAGNHTLTIFGLEGCCDGFQQAQFRIGDGGYTTFASSDGLDAVPGDVPEPATVATLGLGLGLLAVTRRRKRA